MSITIARDTDEVPLFNRADQQQVKKLAAAIESAAVIAGPTRITDAPAVADAAEEYDAFVAEATERSPKVQITALRKQEWRDLIAEHPPRKPVTDEDGEVEESWPEDEMFGVNIDTVADPLVKASITPDQFDDQAELEAFVDDLGSPHFNRIVGAALRLNTEAGPDPKWSASSWLAQTSAVMSRSPESSGSVSQRSSEDSPTRIATSSEPSG